MDVPFSSPQGAGTAAHLSDGAGWRPVPVDRGFGPGVDVGIGDAVRTSTASWRGTLRRARQAEGPRGVALRWSVLLRYFGYLSVIIVCSAVANAAFAGTPWRMGGTLVLFASCMMTVTASLGCMFMPYKRYEILEDWRHFMFQVSVLPATGIAMFQWVMRAYTANPLNQDNFLGLLSNALPMLFAFTVFIPSVVFVKAVAGRRVLERSQQDDQELIETWTRQDHLMR